MAEDLIIKDWQTGIGDSAHLGFGNVKNADIEAFPGAVKVGKKPSAMFIASVTSTFTVDASTDILTTASNITTIVTGAAVRLSSTVSLPSPLITGTDYFAINLSNVTMRVATSISNASLGNYINVTNVGTGTHTVATLNPGQINHFAHDPRTGNLFAYDSNGVVWYTTGDTFFVLKGYNSASTNGNGLALSSFSGGTATSLFVFRNHDIDVVDVYSTSNLQEPSWSYSWFTMNTAAGTNNLHHAINSQDNAIYFGDDRWVGKISEASGKVFVAADATTYAQNNQALDLPQRETVYWLEELGTNLMIGGGSYNYIYPWDRTSSSFNLPIAIPENGIQRMKNIGNVIYILAGTRGHVYSTQGTGVRDFKKLPDQIINNGASVTGSVVTWGGIGQRNGALLFGVSATTGSNSGVYLLYPDGRLIIDNQPSTGAANVTAIYSASDFYTFGYNGGADNFNVSNPRFSTSRYASFETVLQSALYRVADKTGKGSYSTLEVQIAKPCTTGHIRVGWRGDTQSAFTVIDTYTMDSINTSFNSDAGLINIENIQVQVEMDGDIELMEVRLKK